MHSGYAQIKILRYITTGLCKAQLETSGDNTALTEPPCAML